MKNIIFTLCFAALIMVATSATAKSPNNIKSKFYDFGEQVIDGNIKTPTALYTSARQKVKFVRLLKLKKSFLPNLNDTEKENTFK